MNSLIQITNLKIKELEKKFQVKLIEICRSNDSEESKQNAIEALIIDNLKLITDEDLNLFFMWNKSTVKIESDGTIQGEYKFGEMGTFSATDCFNGYQDLISDIAFKLISEWFKP